VAGSGTATGSAPRASAASGLWIWVVTNAPTSIDAIAIVKIEATVRDLVFISVLFSLRLRGSFHSRLGGRLCKFDTVLASIPAHPRPEC
jgi:hypothetical protein